MKLINVIVLIYMCFTWLSCANVNSIAVVQENIEINRSSLQTEDTTFFSDVHVIKMDNGNNVALGDAARIYCSGDTLFVLNSLKNEVVVISKDGQYIKTINKQGKGHGEYIQLIDFAYDNSSNKLLFLTAPSAISTYTTEGTFLSRKKLSDYYSNISVDSSHIYLYHVTYIEGRKCEYTIDAINKETDKISHILPFEKEYAPYCSIGNSIFNNKGRCVFVRKFDRNIYELSHGEVQKSIFFVPDESTLLPKDDDTHFNCSDLLNKCLRENKVYGFSNVVYNDQHLMCSTNLWDIVIKSGQICNSYSSIQNTRLGIPMRMFRPIEGNSDYDICFYLQESEIESIKKIIGKNTEVRKKVSKDLISLINEEDTCNPILFLYKFRK